MTLTIGWTAPRCAVVRLIALATVTGLTFSFAGEATRKPEVGSKAEKDAKSSWEFQADPALPNVLILGDSISIGYTLEVRKLLNGKANVFRPMAADGKRPANCSGTTLGVKEIEHWLGQTKWSVIHFNWGLHDMKRVTEPGGDKTTSNPADPVQATVDVYSKNLSSIVERLKATNARLIFAATTPVVPGTKSPYRDPEDPARYNAAAFKIMEANGIRVNDLYAFIHPQLDKLQLPKNVHFTDAGSRALAEQVAKIISEELAKSKP